MTEIKSIQSLIDENLKRKDEERSASIAEKTKGFEKSWSPSSFGKCYRAQYWKRKGKEISDPIDDRTRRVFQAGHLFHDFVQQFIQDAQCEVVCKRDDIYGRADIVNNDTVWDLKSQHSRSFWYMKDMEDIKESKKPNWLQLACYAWILNKKKMRLVFISKDDLCIKEYGDTLENWIRPLYQELETLRKFWREDKTPPAEPRAYKGKDGKPKECNYCSYKTICKEVEKCQTSTT
jgi:predicted RecB family nuclease